MILSEFNLPANQKINKMNKVLKEHFGVSVAKNYPSKAKLEKVLESANMAVVKLRTSNKKFQLEADYAKFLGIRDIVETMLAEGMYAESPSYKAMKREMVEKVRTLMDKGYSDEEACAECMNQYRADSRYVFDEAHVKGIVQQAAKDFIDECMYEGEDDSLDGELIDEAGFDIDSIDDFDQDLDADEFGNAQMFPDSIPVYDQYRNIVAEVFRSKGFEWGYYVHANQEQAGGFQDLESAFNAAAIEAGEFTRNKIVNPYAVHEAYEGYVQMGNLLQEEVDVEQAEVVMAVRALADDIQDQVERLGRMINEEVPAIADQIRGEQGASAAQAFADQMAQIINAQLENARNAKTQMDAVVDSVSGGAPVAPDMTAPDMSTNSVATAPAPEEDAEDAEDINEPAAAGPAEEPLGRAAI